MVRELVKAKGAERIAQLVEQFPGIPPLIVLKTDLIREGIRHTSVIDKIGKWALPDAHDYFEFDYEDTHSAEDTREGYTLTPVVCHFTDEVSYRPMFDSRSPYEIRYEERGRYRIYRDGDPMEEVFFPPRPEWYSKTTSKGKPVSSIISLRAETCMWIAPLTYCEYFKDDNGCRYCNIVPSETTKKGLGMDRTGAKRPEEVREVFLMASEEARIRHVHLSGGVILNSSKEADVYAGLISALKGAMKEAGYECPVTIKCQAMEAKDQMKLKEAGLNGIGFNLEVWDNKLFEIICPGKAKYVGQEEWKDRLLQSVEIFGRASSTLVVGVNMAEPYGFKTEDESAESTIEGWEWMASHGISPGSIMWRPAPGSALAGGARPRTEYFLRMAQTCREVMLKHGMARKGRCNRCFGQTINQDW